LCKMFWLSGLRQACSSSTSVLSLNVRQFSSTPTVAKRQVRKIPVLSKKAAAAKAARKKAAKTQKHIYHNERMPLESAVHVLRSVEVARPQSTFELVVRTAMGKGTTIPKGRISLPREAKTQSEDRILVFAEGRQADEARKAGAHIVGGPELIDAVINGRHQATTILCTTGLIRTITPRLGRILGPRGLMPSERRGTVTDDIEGFIRRLQGTTEWKGDKSGTIRMPIAKVRRPFPNSVSPPSCSNSNTFRP